MNDLGLFPPHILLQSSEQAYVHCILCRFDSISTKNTYTMNFQTGNRNARLEKQAEYNSIWFTNLRKKIYRQHL